MLFILACLACIVVGYLSTAAGSWLGGLIFDREPKPSLCDDGNFIPQVWQTDLLVTLIRNSKTAEA